MLGGPWYILTFCFDSELRRYFERLIDLRELFGVLTALNYDSTSFGVETERLLLSEMLSGGTSRECAKLISSSR